MIRCAKQILEGMEAELEIFRTCIPCQTDLVDLALELHLGTEVED